MTQTQRDRILAAGLNPDDFAPSAEQTTIADIVEALDILTGIVLGEE